MTTLPTEVLYEIFLHLHQADKIECLLVCREWKNIIEELALYHTVHLKSDQQLKQFADKIIDEPTLGKKVERLIVPTSSATPCEVDLNALFLLLPNLKILYYAGPSPDTRFLMEGYKYPFHKSIKSIVDARGAIAIPLFLSNMCAKLTTLSIHVRDGNIDFLKNTPALTDLEICSMTISFHKINTIHCYLPQLKSVGFRESKFEDDNTFKDIVVPAVSVTKLIINMFGMRNFEASARVKLLSYIREKYPNISSLTYYMISHLKTAQEIELVNNHGLIPLLSHLGPRLKHLDSDEGANNDDYLKVLDSGGCQINYLNIALYHENIILNITQSQQIYYIQSLTLTQRKEREDLHEYQWLGQLKVLKEFKYFGNSNYIALDCILEYAPPSLKSLSLECVGLYFKRESGRVYNIETLSLCYVCLADDFDESFSRCFPKLSTFTWDRFDGRKKRFDLSKLNLKRFEYDIISPYKPVKVVISTLGNGKKRFYKMKNRDVHDASSGYSVPDYPLYVPFKSYDEDYNNAKIDLFLICNSIKEVVFI